MEKVFIQSKPLQEKGFIRFDLQREWQYPAMRQELAQLQQAFADLPLDPYAPNTTRFRRYSRAIILPWNGTLHWLPNHVREDGVEVCEYFQGTFNAEYVDEYRAFTPLTEETKANPLLHNIIQYDFAQTFWDARDLVLPIHVGVHLVKFDVRPGEEAFASPNHIHQDGEPFTFAHLITYHNVQGGINVIAHTECAGKQLDEVSESQILDQFLMTEPLDSYGVCDKLVCHYVSPVTCGPDDEYAERGMLLIDYTPTVIAIT
ncbi:2OG-Fe dioxygenase family protein [Laceyella putida]|uniref:2OG-Fe dioxygenase family protein n=1 Tax=Laceyella putida TaxID=110101 RepID=A0ABW2RJJ5_9BACL